MMKNTRKLISLLLALTIIFSSMSVLASAADYNDVVAFEAYATKELIENYNGSQSEFREDDQAYYYFCYDVYQTNPIFKITFGNGEIFEGNEEELYEFFNWDVYVSLSYDQSYDNQWKAGESHTVTMDLYSFYNDSTIASCEMTVNIVESPIASVSVNETDLIENCNGYWEDRWNDATEEYENYFYYYLSNFYI